MGQTATPAKLRQLAAALELEPNAYSRALELAGLLPDRQTWLRGINLFLAALGTALIVAGIAAFFAWNWADMRPMLKFALVEGAIVASVLTAWRMGLDSVVGRSALFAAAFLVGILLAVFGQVYQTGADPFGLFLGWALLVLPWALVGRQAGLWMLVAILANLSLILFWTQVLHPPSGWWQLSQLLGPLVWLSVTILDFRLGSCVFALNIALLALWEYRAWSGADWIRSRWFPRLVALGALSVVLIPTLIIAVGAAMNEEANLSSVSPVLFVGTVAVSLYYYRYKQPDLLILTLSLVGCIMVLTCLFARGLSGIDHGLVLAFAVVAQTAGAAVWLRKVMRDWEKES